MSRTILVFSLLVILIIGTSLAGGKFLYLLLFITISILFYSYFSIKKIEKNLVGIFWCNEKAVQKGEKLIVEYKIYNSGILPIPYIEITDRIPRRLTNRKGDTSVYSFLPYDTLIIKKEVECKHRGYFQLGNIRVRIGDVFGIFEREFTLNDNLYVTVYPKIYKLNRLNIFGREYYGSLPTNEKYYEDYSSIKDLRKYEKGDSLKRINWKASAKKGELIVKNYDISADLKVKLFMDFQLSKYNEDIDGLFEEKIVECTFSILYYAILNNIDIEFITYTEKFIKYHGKNAESFHDLLELSTRIKPAKNINIGELLAVEARLLSVGTTIILITPFPDSNIVSQILGIKSKGYDVILILVHEPIVNRNLDKQMTLLQKSGIKVYKISLDDDISYVLR